MAIGFFLAAGIGSVVIVLAALYGDGRLCRPGENCLPGWLAGIGALAAAAAALATLLQTRQSSERQLRAYIDVVHSAVENADMLSPVFTITFRNYGATPARSVRVHVDTGIRQDEDAEETFADAIKRQAIRLPNAPPGEDFRIPVPFGPMTPDDVLALKRAGTRLWIFGFLIYMDAFGHERRTEFRKFADTSDGVLRDGELITSATPDNST